MQFIFSRPIVAAVVLFHQYRTRRTLRSALFLTAGLFGVVVCLAWTPIDLDWMLRRLFQEPPPTAFQLEVPDRLGGWHMSSSGQEDFEPLVVAVVDRPDPVYQIQLTSIRTRFALPTRTIRQWLPEFRIFPSRQTKPSGRGYADDSADLIPVLRLPFPSFQEIERVPGRLHSRFYLRAVRESEIGQLPLTVGASFEDGPLTVEVSSVEVVAGDLHFGLEGRTIEADPSWRGSFRLSEEFPDGSTSSRT